MNELVMALREGTSSSSSSSSDKLQIEHLLLLGSTKAVDKAVKRLVDGVLELGRVVVESVQIVAIGAAVCLVLTGTSQVIAAYKQSSQDANATMKKQKKERKSKSDGASVETDTNGETIKDEGEDVTAT
ncbi:hypothetical protein MPSEU_000552500 [Mayamaea pseudoterrestris]|nr:hypothetical protein MPSEU_000552500 [Mayamaea pseudoterrestris]